jgi:3-hydroxymyristoyl/3-hydroxydecanoyl-(acyl carrier protein) dehydratase
MWEPWLLEGLAQTAAVLNGKNAKDEKPKKGMLVGARGLKILRRPRAGETIRYHVNLIKRLGPLTLVEGTAWVGDESIASGNLKFYVEDL